MTKTRSLTTRRSVEGKRVVESLRAKGNSSIAAHSHGFFRAGPGGYGDGDQFLGLRVPVIREEVKRTKLSIPLAVELLQSPYHEVRMFAVVAMVELYPKQKDEVYEAYVANRHRVNNWDLVDVSAPHILGAHLMTRPRDVLDEFAAAESPWDRRMAVVATFAFIRENQFDDTLRLATTLLDDPHDLIHKAVGWMLREVGKRDADAHRDFLDKRATVMPRTMLRYAIEKLPKAARQAYLRGK
ncbi:hypothetical protein CTAYLR_006933 [Chrysophaeum taylorii]|uniref:DNA alkylation repair protein n=1 Tax=Chrysophaeum taylorii TaxID=2483200 RepID=A0AAD7XIH9_9STRA|nr:hypothetical protein CTAYLR_006933 [Chrysophaeum taylorii]